MVSARCRVKVALRHTYITLPQVASHTARLRTRLKLGQEDKTNMSVTLEKKDSLNPFPDPSPNPNPNMYRAPLDHKQFRTTVHTFPSNVYSPTVI